MTLLCLWYELSIHFVYIVIDTEDAPARLRRSEIDETSAPISKSHSVSRGVSSNLSSSVFCCDVCVNATAADDDDEEDDGGAKVDAAATNAIASDDADTVPAKLVFVARVVVGTVVVRRD